MTVWQQESRRIAAIFGVLMAALFAALSLASLVYDMVIDPYPLGMYSDAIDSVLYMVHQLSSIIAIILVSATTLSGQRLALQAYKVIVTLVAASALLAAIRLVYVNQLPGVVCELPLPASILVTGVWLRSRSDRRKVNTG